MLKILHTADWHVGLSFKQFKTEDATKLARDRLRVVDEILGRAEQYDVDAVLCAGDLFDRPDPAPEWWQALAQSFCRRKTWNRPVVLLPGNHDPLTDNSVYNENHEFRRTLPKWVQVVDREGFQLEIEHDAVVYASPCRSKAGDKDLALSLPSRQAGDTRVRIGMVHGSALEMEGRAINFPVSREAPQRRGLDYLALGDWHGFCEIPDGATAPIVYPSAPEPTKFGEDEAGYVALASFTRHGTRPQIRRERVARWTWRQVKIQSLAQLNALAAEDLTSTVLRLTLDLTVSIPELEEVEGILQSFEGTEATSPRTGALVCDRSGLRFNAQDGLKDQELDLLPETIRLTATRLRAEAVTSPEAQRALVTLQRLLHEVR